MEDRGNKYEKLELHEHILLRPDSYIGSVNKETVKTYIYNEEIKMMQLKSVTQVPGLLKIFDEILVNAADNRINSKTQPMSYIKVNIDKEKGEISVENDGDGIPVEEHEKEKMMIPSLIFGVLLTGSNYNDEEEKITGGRNGYGAKLTNIYSKEFTVETFDSKVGKKFKQVWSKNMYKAGKAKITSLKRKKDFTKVTFIPDFEKFGLEGLDDDHVALITRRVFDIAATSPKIKVHLNGTKVPVKSFKDYVKLYVGPDQKIYHKVVNDHWEIAVTDTEDQFQHVSFVNSIFTRLGGEHVKHVSKPIIKGLTDHVKKKNKGISVKPAMISSHLWLFVNCQIVNPSFSSQTKEQLTSQSKTFKTKCKIDDKVMKDIISKTQIAEKATELAEAKSKKGMARKLSATKKKRVTGIRKLEDANEAGGRNSSKCTLILTEGDSAKALAIAGLSVAGRDHYGVFPLKGKPLNVRKTNREKVQKNEEISTIIKIMGLKFGKDYDQESIKTLRYGSIMIMADQDHDGSHIKGLLISFLQFYWPTLLKIPGFLKEFITPIIKIKHKRTKQELTFFSIPEFEKWSRENNNGEGWENPKYYKGLGTSTAKEGKEYFSNLPKHVIDFKFDEGGFEKIKMAFDASGADERKHWMNSYEEGSYIDHNLCRRSKLNYSEFIDKELVLFSIADTLRSIPSLVDGFKPSQRKVLFSCFKRKLTKELKVAQLSGYVSEHSAYHHGEQSLNGTIIGMAQNFIGSNNINLLSPNGQFGTRLLGGKDASSPRYIFTKLSEITRYLFPSEDDNVLHYLKDDGLSIEPKYYCPIIPMILVNGCSGIGTGYSTNIPNFEPRQILNNIRRMIKGEELVDMTPYYKYHLGEMKYLKRHSWQSSGIIEFNEEDSTYHVSELPVKLWTEKFKERLEVMEEKSQIIEFRQNHTDVTVSFTISVSDEQKAKIEAKTPLEFFGLTTKFTTSNMTLFGPDEKIYKYDHINDIMKEFYNVRLNTYAERKDFLLRVLQREMLILDNKMRFIKEVINGGIVIRQRKKSDIVAELREKNFDPYPQHIQRVGIEEPAADEDEDNTTSNDYNYLLKMPLWSLTVEKVEKLKSEHASKKEEIEKLTKTTEKELWLKDLEAFENKLDEVEEKERIQAEKEAKNHHKSRNNSKSRPAKRKRAAPVPKKKETTKKAATKKKSEEIKPKKVTKRVLTSKKKEEAAQPSVKNMDFDFNILDSDEENEKEPPRKRRKITQVVELSSEDEMSDED